MILAHVVCDRLRGIMNFLQSTDLHILNHFQLACSFFGRLDDIFSYMMM